MRNYTPFSVRVIICVFMAALFPFRLVQGASNLWAQAGSLAQARAGSAAALLSDGRVLVTGGTDASGALATTEFFTPETSFSPGVSMLQARTNHTAVVLRDGRVIVAGGTTIDGSLTNTAEIYDPSTNVWTSVSGGMVVARAGHTASLLKDGRVLVAGGQGTNGAINTLEIFSPDTNLFAAVTSAVLSIPKQQHAAAVLADGRVLIAGGSDGTNALNSADIFDPSSGSVVTAGQMSTPRASLSATTLLDGTVLIVGGNDGTADLASAEIYDASAKSFSVTGNLASARTGHVAFLLPNNNEVLITAGQFAGAALSSAELFVPWEGRFTSTGALGSARLATAGTSLKEEGHLLIAGGTNGSNTLSIGELFDFATITTDASDYPPGTTVNISGSGWQPGETVNLTLVESPFYDTHGPYTALADSNGKIFNNQFATDAFDANIRFYLTAKGSVSQAQMTFTDSTSLKSVLVGAQSPSSIAPRSSATYQVTVGFNGNGSCTVRLGVNTALPSGATATFSPSLLTGTSSQSAGSSTLTIATTNSTPGGTTSFTVQAQGTGGTGNDCNTSVIQTTTGNLVVTSSIIATTLTLSAPSPSSVGFGSTGPVTLKATLTRTSGGAAVSGATVTFTVDGSSVGTTVTDGTGLATFSSYNPSALTAGSHNLQATFVQQTISGTTYSASTSGSQALTISKATPVMTWANPANITYGTPLSATQLNATASVPGTFVYSPVSGTVLSAGNQTLSVAFTPTDSTDYTTANKNVQLTISHAVLTVTANDAAMTYGGTLPSFSAKYSGLVNSDPETVVTGTPSFTPTTAPTSAGTSAITPAQGTLTAANYTFTFVNGTLTVHQAVLTVTANDAAMTYGGTLPSFSAKYSGFVNSETETVVTGTPSFTPTTAPTSAGTSAITPAQGTLAAANYTFTFVNGTLTVNKAVLTITPDGGKSKLLNSTFTAFTGTQTGLQNSDTITINYASLGAPPSAAVGVYDVTVASVTFTQGSASNYTIVKNTATKGLTVSYNACLLYDPTRAVKGGATYPVKLYLCDANTLDVSSPGVVLNATAVSLIGASSGAVEDAGNANPDSNFRYDATLGPSGGYIFNLKTSGLRTGSYNLTFTAGGASTSYSVGFGVK